MRYLQNTSGFCGTLNSLWPILRNEYKAAGVHIGQYYLDSPQHNNFSTFVHTTSLLFYRSAKVWTNMWCEWEHAKLESGLTNTTSGHCSFNLPQFTLNHPGAESDFSLSWWHSDIQLFSSDLKCRQPPFFSEDKCWTEAKRFTMLLMSSCLCWRGNSWQTQSCMHPMLFRSTFSLGYSHRQNPCNFQNLMRQIAL